MLLFTYRAFCTCTVTEQQKNMTVKSKLCAKKIKKFSAVIFMYNNMTEQLFLHAVKITILCCIFKMQKILNWVSHNKMAAVHYRNYTDQHQFRVPDKIPVRSSRLIFSGCGEESKLESTGCSFGGLTETGERANMNALVLSLCEGVQKMMSRPCQMNARWYLGWSRTVLLS